MGKYAEQCSDYIQYLSNCLFFIDHHFTFACKWPFYLTGSCSFPSEFIFHIKERTNTHVWWIKQRQIVSLIQIPCRTAVSVAPDLQFWICSFNPTYAIHLLEIYLQQFRAADIAIFMNAIIAAVYHKLSTC